MQRNKENRLGTMRGINNRQNLAALSTFDSSSGSGTVSLNSCANATKESLDKTRQPKTSRNRTEPAMKRATRNDNVLVPYDPCLSFSDFDFCLPVVSVPLKGLIVVRSCPCRPASASGFIIIYLQQRYVALFHTTFDINAVTMNVKRKNVS